MSQSLKNSIREGMSQSLKNSIGEVKAHMEQKLAKIWKIFKMALKNGI